MSQETYIAYAKRTPIGKFSGGLSTLPAPQLGAVLVKDALKSLLLSEDSVDEILMGQVLTAGAGQAPARQTALYGGLSQNTCAMTLNRVCGSGLKAVMLADQSIRLGDSELVMAGGQENMSLAPHMLLGSRNGIRFGDGTLKDHMQMDGLWDPYNNIPMGNCGEFCAQEYNFSREDQDKFAIESYRRSRQSTENGDFADEIVPVEITSRRGSTVIDKDEEPFSVDLDKLTKLRPAFDSNGTITAGNASSINDGAALLVLCNKAKLDEHKLTPVARIVAHASFAQDPKWFTTAPITSIEKVLNKAKLSVKDIDLFEINEAFAVVTMAAQRKLVLASEKVNVFGGAVSIGHPIGASGARILVTLLNALKKKGGKRGLASICIGGGEASSMIVERL